MPALAPLCAGLGIALLLLRRHSHSRFLAIDILAQISRLNRINPSLKFWTGLALMILCTASRSPAVGLFLTAVMLVLIVCAGGLRFSEYLRTLSLPVSFLMLSALALLFEVTSQPAGVISIPILSFYLSVGKAAQIRTALVVGRALGALSCLYMISLTTPMSELIGVLRRARCPHILIVLMYLIYRYIFLLLDMYHTMRDAAKSRLGYAGYHARIKTTGGLYANLLSRSYRQAGKSFDAMESRCFNNDIRFLEHFERVTAIQAVFSVAVTLVTLSMTVLLY